MGKEVLPFDSAVTCGNSAQGSCLLGGEISMHSLVKNLKATYLFNSRELVLINYGPPM